MEIAIYITVFFIITMIGVYVTRNDAEVDRMLGYFLVGATWPVSIIIITAAYISWVFVLLVEKAVEWIRKKITKC